MKELEIRFRMFLKTQIKNPKITQIENNANNHWL